MRYCTKRRKCVNSDIENYKWLLMLIHGILNTCYLTLPVNQ